jgi:threonine/homoserine/homoserine lactone efflux protein
MLRVMEPFMSFLGVATLAMLIPGPDTFVVLRASLVGGAQAGRRAAAGSATGNLIWGAATVAGVAGVLAASATAFSAVKLAGALYLALLGVRALLAATRGQPLAPAADDGGGASAWAAYRAGLASDLLNVKVGVFWMALVPQFTTADSSALLPVAMVCAMGALAFAWLTAYAQLAARLRGLLRQQRTARTVNAVVGLVLVALGVALACDR